ncbi:unnamed protein product [Rotaria sordida]|uniref:SWIM-type domain-containing protein n=1 Tax=Rotaria sordida TaxID=392033 RepID=A0A815WYS6_9BILA|nr:unnamed protein product [Rotaria sordida]CAF1552217.1 unnamed protein product [Rotaria sordida]
MVDINSSSDVSNAAMDIGIDDSSSQTIQMNGNLTNIITKEVVKLKLNSTSSSHRTCCICSSNLKNNSANISSEDRDFLFFTRNIWIPKGARCCSDHLINHRLKKEAIDEIKPLSIREEELNSSDVQLLLSKSQILFENQNRRFNFDDLRGLTDDEYRLLTSLSKDDFNEFVEIVSSSSIRNSSNRSIRTAVGIYLCKLYLGLSNRLLACWWCDCNIGGRFLGCCSHISSAIWFLCYERWQTRQRHMSSGSYMTLATDAIQVSDFYDSSDNEDDNISRYSLL